MSLKFQEAMVKRCNFIHKSFVCALLLVVSATLPALAEEKQSYHEHKLELGYRAVSDDDTTPVRAREYDYLHSSPAGSLKIKGGSAEGHYNIEGAYLNEKDFDAEANINAGSVFRIDILSQSLFHNLEHIPYQSGAQGSRSDISDDSGLFIRFEDEDPADTYGVRVLQNMAEAQFKAKTYPAHVTLRYWRLDRSGNRQMRWLDEGGGAFCGQCHMNSKSRDINNTTEEFTATVDGHVGAIDLILEQVFRKFHDSEPIPKDSFGGNFLRAPGDYQHDEPPDSRLSTTTVKAHTSLSGGFVAAGSVTFGKRENRSDLADVEPVESETTYVKGAGDVTWIPAGEWTLNLRYRALDMENDSNAQIEAVTDPGTDPPGTETYDVRDTIDLRRYDYVTSVAYRPSTKVTIKGEGEYKETCRSNTNGPQEFSGFGGINDPVWELPADETVNRYKLSLLARPFDKNVLKVRSWYQYLHSNDPAYGITIEDGHSAFVGFEWHPGRRWGVGVNARADFQKNRNIATVVDDGTDDQATYFRDRDNDKQNLTAMIWGNPTDRLSFGIHYAYMRTEIEQDLLLGTDEGNNLTRLAEGTEYSQWVQSLAANSSWRILAPLTLRAEGRYIRSHSAYDPEFADTVVTDYNDLANATVTPTGLRELSKIDIRQFGGSAGLDWVPDETWRTSFTYTYDKYDDLEAEIFDGKVETYMVSLARTW